MIQIGQVAPDFTAETTQGPIHFHEWIGNSWAVLFSHPKDFTPVCTTELGAMAKLKPEFDKRDIKIIGLSVDPVANHAKWAKDIEETQGAAVNYPMIGDTELDGRQGLRHVAGRHARFVGRPYRRRQSNRAHGLRHRPGQEGQTAARLSHDDGAQFRRDPARLDSLQLTARHKVATPANWKNGQDVIIAGSVTDEEAKTRYPQGWKSPKPYLRIVPQPK